MVALLVLAAFPAYIAPLETFVERTAVTDIAGAGPALSTVGLGTAVLFFMPGASRDAIRARAAPSALLLMPFWIFAAVAYVFVWERSPDVRGGLLALAIAGAAWVVGDRLAYSVLKYGNGAFRIILWGIAVVIVVEAALATVQVLSGTATNSGRGYGTFAHPAVLGKYSLLVLPIILPAMASADRALRRPAAVAMVAVFVGTAATVSRANILAVAAVLVGWSLLRVMDARQSGRAFRRTALPVILVFLSLPFVSLLIERIEADPEGGDRDLLLAAGLRVITSNLEFGTGPNNYVNVARNTEAIVAITGYPVHNSFLLGIAELGVLGTLLFCLPILASIIQAFRMSTESRAGIQAANMSRAYLLSAAGIVFVALSGWGFWQEPTLTMIFLISGFVRRQVLETAAGRADVHQPASGGLLSARGANENGGLR